MHAGAKRRGPKSPRLSTGMYELTCPSCERTDRLPFVRLGAVLDCPGCGQRYQVDAAHVTNHYPQQAATLDNNPFVEEASRARRRDDQKTGPPDAGAQTSPPPPVAASAAADSLSQAVWQTSESSRPNQARLRRAMRLRQKRKRGPMVGLLSALVALVAIFAVLIYYAVTRSPGMGSPTDGGNTTVIGGSQQGPIAGTSGMPPMVVADWVRPRGWREVDRPVPADTQRDIPLRLLDSKWVLHGDRPLFKATVICVDQDMFVSAMVRLSLVDDQETVYAQADLPLALVGPERPSEVFIRVPQRFYDRMERLHAQLQPGPRIENPVVLSGTTLRVHGRGLHVTSVIESQNITNQTLSGAVFLVSAVDRSNMPLAQWRMDWVKPIDPGGQVHFAALTAVDEEWQVARWEIFAVGEPAGDTGVPPGSGPDTMDMPSPGPASPSGTMWPDDDVIE